MGGRPLVTHCTKPARLPVLQQQIAGPQKVFRKLQPGTLDLCWRGFLESLGMPPPGDKDKAFFKHPRRP
ncbi:hypothetical protein CapIbe_014662 [Capra ibex]